VIEISLKSGSSLIEFCFQEQNQWIPLQCYAAMLHVLLESACYKYIAIHSTKVHAIKMTKHDAPINMHKHSNCIDSPNAECQEMQNQLKNVNLSKDIEDGINNNKVRHRKCSSWPCKKYETKTIFTSSDRQTATYIPSTHLSL